MDRGVKIAIFVASIASLGLGLIWDQVLSHARVMVEQPADDVLAAEVMEARMGSPEIARLEVPEDLDPQFQPKPVDEPTVERAAPEEAPPVEQEWTEYTVQPGDSWWKLAYVRFKERGLSSDDIMRANQGRKLVPGEKLMIPPGKEALKAGPPPQAADSNQPAPASSTGETAYTVQEGDSWWKIAYVRFKDRGITTKDLEDANPGVKLVAGAKIKIPAK
ncbi:MAG: LysM peptidoglycan-binding domain-containing protein [Planctomycetes bacterium]|nr:LysM peptidoglycan-binding domain-containing protein [Planctomycetota bacterium]MCB9934660.1 LysM peptidoglycan-binding domain-containing protein [Planctomycetota bacterium]